MTAHANGAADRREQDCHANSHSPPVQGSAEDVPDAGLRSLDHYKRALPHWRYQFRQRMLPLIRWETPYLAWVQDRVRTPALDSYFAITANLGTHTFFMIGLPMLFWFGYTSFGKGLVHILASGVFFTGFVKDFCSLPRPLSPPLNRITMSGSAALEYGFPSTHSANAVSVAVYGVLVLHGPDCTLPETVRVPFEILAYFYAASIIIGRLYCGMHGFLDVIVGSVMGAAISLIEFYYGPPLDAYMHGSSWWAPVIAALVVIILVRIHPEPADDCPCFDDSVAFAGVVIGLEFASWSYGRLGASDPFRANAHEVVPSSPDELAALGWPVLVARLVFGVFIVFAWREVMKPALLRFLPHLFRLIERAGLSLPRRFFVSASEYKVVPPGSRMDSLIPSVRDFPRVVESIRHPTTRGRSVSVGPQSAADAYETLAYRERRRRESIGSNGSLRSKGSLYELKERHVSSGSAADANVTGDASSPERDAKGTSSSVQGGSALAEYEKKMGTGFVSSSHLLSTPVEEKGETEAFPVLEEHDLYYDGGDGDEMDEKQMFTNLVRPRVRYDIEVVTKLIVYTGIAWLSVGMIPLIFEFVGLGSNHLRADA